ncbi:carbohydrate-binding protein [Streptomyces sp. NBC_01465]|uniref:carbohydrate-binding protein n=1 Tax=Streptomyces sp. NBC_01465 TaxID=2903878 RepID=UPI002E3437B6|nr:carbohydrate-binding protein [Streptomyces sp. NBC_01465]
MKRLTAVLGLALALMLGIWQPSVSAAPAPDTADWDTWATRTFTVPLDAGSNTVRLTATTANGAPNLDCLDGPA